MTRDRSSTQVRTGTPVDGGVDAGQKDLLAVLIALLVCLIGIPSALIVEALGAAGTPAGVLGDVLLFVVLGSWLASSRAAGRTSPTTWLVLAFSVAISISYLAGMLRPITTDETNSADRGLLVLGSWVGSVLAITYGISARDRLDLFLRTLTYLGAALALLGAVQFFAGIDIASYLHVPGLTANHAFGELNERSGFRRVTGTAQHPIEFGVVITLILPVALHYAFQAKKGNRLWPWSAATATCFAVPLTVARSTILGLVTVVALLVLIWTWRQRRNALLLLPVGIVIVKTTTPHLLGSILHLFTRASDDPSVQNRLGDYTAAGNYIAHSPIFGRGFFTFLPQIYRTFDNQYLGILVEAGLVGFAALVLLLVGSCVTAFRVRMRARDEETRSLAYALMVSVAVAVVTFATFDAVAFPMCMGVTFVIIGSIGCLWRLTNQPEVAPAEARVPVAGRSALRVLAAALTLAAVAGAFQFVSADRTKFQAIGTVSLSSASSPVHNPYQRAPFLGDLPLVLRTAITGPASRAGFAAAGDAGYEVNIGTASVAPYTDQAGTGNLMRVSSVADSADLAAHTAQSVIDGMVSQLAAWQDAAGVPRPADIRISETTTPTAVPISGRKVRAEAMLIALALLLWYLLDRALVRGRVSPYRRPATSDRTAQRLPVAAR